jgi:hypothetical protein
MRARAFFSLCANLKSKVKFNSLRNEGILIFATQYYMLQGTELQDLASNQL